MFALVAFAAGGPAPVTGEDVRAALSIAVAAEESVRTGKAVTGVPERQ